MQQVSPEEVGLSTARLARLERALRAQLERGELAGMAVFVARHGRLAHAAAYGHADLDGARPLRPDAIFRIASMTKPITSVAAMVLFEQGRFLLTDPLEAYLPEFKDVQVYAGQTPTGPKLVPPAEAITIWHLLTHTAGFGYPDTDQSPVATLYQAAGISDSDALADFAHRLARLPLFVDPGSRWHYGYAHDVLARVVEVVADRPFGAFLQAEIFEPLGMTETGYFVPAGELNRLPTVVGPAAGGGLGAILPPGEADSRHPGLEAGGHGLFSTGADYLRFAQMLLNGGHLDGRRLLSRKTVAFMTANHLPDRLLPMQYSPESVLHGHGYGLGLGVILDPVADQLPGSLGTFYWSGAYDTQFWVDPQEALVGLYLSQYQPSGTHPARRLFRTLVYQALDD